MTSSPDAVLLYIPLMKEMNLSWEEIKRTPRHELRGLLAANYEHNLLHSMDGYDAKDIGDMAKDKPSIRSDWNRYMECRRKYEILSGKENNSQEAQLMALKSQL